MNIRFLLILVMSMTFTYDHVHAKIRMPANVCTDNNSPPMVVKGKFHLKLLGSNKLVQGVYWTVRVSWKNGSRPKQECTARTDEEGTWEVTISKPAHIRTIEVSIFSKNEYVVVGPRPEASYEVFNAQFKLKPSQEKVVDLGPLIADLSGQGSASATDMAGVGDVMAAASDFWYRTWSEKLYVQSHRRDGTHKAIRIYFPNEKYDCGNENGLPATCSGWDERSEIWITGGDIKDVEPLGRRLTVMHELAHQLNADRWNYGGAWVRSRAESVGERPCLAPENALTEGFATAIAAWAIYGADHEDPRMVWLDDDRIPVASNLERPIRESRCPKGEHDAEWISALFWDLIDTQVDPVSRLDPGQDKWSFKNPMEPFKIYLDGSPQKSIQEYLLMLKKYANTTMSSKSIDEISRNNNMAVP